MISKKCAIFGRFIVQGGVDDTIPLVKSWSDGLHQSTESPIFDASFWSENGVSCSHERNKIGDSVLWITPAGRKSCAFWIRPSISENDQGFSVCMSG